jgi:hypothetical protein
LTTDSQNEITDKRKSIDLCGATDSAEYTNLDEGAIEIGNDLHEQNLQVFLLPDDIISVAIDVKFNSNFSTK